MLSPTKELLFTETSLSPAFIPISSDGPPGIDLRTQIVSGKNYKFTLYVLLGNHENKYFVI